MKRECVKLNTILKLLGFDFGRSLITLAELPYFLKTMTAYKHAARDGPFPLRLRSLRPLLLDRKDQAGQINNHYFFQDIWAARKIYAARPARHVDVGSRIDGFVAHILCFMPAEVVDIRPLESEISGLSFIQEDATHLTGYADNSVESVSSLHAVEHFGLGRYGDIINPNACFSAMKALQRVLRPGGHLYFSVPLGAKRVQFNSQRIFDSDTVLKTFDELRLISFAAVDDTNRFVDPACLDDYATASSTCGLFEFTKPTDSHE
jgi:SAM-dependent methyltransferase